jgi:BASS family bile acid:Na+ symporter
MFPSQGSVVRPAGHVCPHHGSGGRARFDLDQPAQSVHDTIGRASAMTSPIPPWLALLVAAVVYSVMFSLGLMIGREQIAAALQRRGVLAFALFAVLVPVPAAAVLAVRLFDLKGVAAAGILLMAISPGAPVALRRAIEAGGGAPFAPALHLVILALAVLSVPASLAMLSEMFGRALAVSPLDVARQVFFVQLLPLGLGAALRAWRPAVAARLEGPLARVTNPLLVAVVVLLLVVLWPRLVEVGWAPFAAGAGLTACALALGAACVWRDPVARPVAAVAAAMRNPGLALLMATVNQMPGGVVASVFGYALGAIAVVTAFVLWQGRRATMAAR